MHIDGARLANAAYSLNVDLKELTTDLGVDLISLGGTKNGFMFGECIISLQPQFQQHLKFLRKQFLNLPSKTRFIAAQFKAYLNNHLWREIAKQSCLHAQLLAENLRQFPEIQITQPVQSNAVFCIFPFAWLKKLRTNKFFYIWNEQTRECRLMLSWDIQETDIDDFINCIKELRNEIPTSSLS